MLHTKRPYAAAENCFDFVNTLDITLLRVVFSKEKDMVRLLQEYKQNNSGIILKYTT